MKEMFAQNLSCLAASFNKQNTVTSIPQTDLSAYPEYLYKYRPCSKNAFDELVQEYLWASKPMYFDDPSDSIVRYHLKQQWKEITTFYQKHCAEIVYFNIEPKGMSTPKGTQKLEEYIRAQKQIEDKNGRICSAKVKSALTKEINKLPQNMRQQILQNISYLNSPEFEKERIEDLQHRATKTANVLRCHIYASCLTERCNNRIMWETYAGKYTGFVIQYGIYETVKVPTHCNSLNSLFPVEYGGRPPAFPICEYAKKLFYKDLYGDSFDNNVWVTALLEHALWKNGEFQEEQEWRICLPADENSKGLQIKAFPIKGVYMGAYIKPHNEARLRNICKVKNIPLYKQSISNITGNMTFETIIAGEKQ